MKRVPFFYFIISIIAPYAPIIAMSPTLYPKIEQAIKNKDMTALKSIINNDPNFLVHKNAKITLLMKATVDDKLPIVDALLAIGADPNFENSKNETALHYAVKKQNPTNITIKTIERLVEAGADINSEDQEGTPLEIAAKRGDQKIVSLLLSNGADPFKNNTAGNQTIIETYPLVKQTYNKHVKPAQIVGTAWRHHIEGNLFNALPAELIEIIGDYVRAPDNPPSNK